MRRKLKKIISRSDRKLEKRLGLKNVIFIDIKGEITKTLMRLVWEKIENHRLKNSRQLFCLMITTNGGDWNPARNFYTLIRLHKINLVTIAVGEIHSAGITVLLSGKKRFAQADTEFMDHDITQETDEKSMRGVHNHLMDICLANRVARKITVKNTKLTAAQVKKMYGGGAEVYFDAYEARRMGFIHTILE